MSGPPRSVLRFDAGNETLEVTPDAVVIAGWTGRDEAAVRHHIDELAAIGVAPPSKVPLYYRTACANAVQTDRLEVVGEETSGEAEPVLIMRGARVWLTLGSDHTDRGLEAHSVALSKQIAAKPLARAAWPLETIDDLDALTLRSRVGPAADRTDLYQDGTLAAIRPLRTLLDGALAALGERPDTAIVYCGTLPTIGGLRPAARFEGTLHDAARDRTISLAYDVSVLPLVA